MDQHEYKRLPDHVEERMETYLQRAKKLSDKWYGENANEEIPLISVNLAAAMINLEAAELMYSAQQRIAVKLEQS